MSGPAFATQKPNQTTTLFLQPSPIGAGVSIVSGGNISVSADNTQAVWAQNEYGALDCAAGSIIASTGNMGVAVQLDGDQSWFQTESTSFTASAAGAVLPGNLTTVIVAGNLTYGSTKNVGVGTEQGANATITVSGNLTSSQSSPAGSVGVIVGSGNVTVSGLITGDTCVQGQIGSTTVVNSGNLTGVTNAISLLAGGNVTNNGGTIGATTNGVTIYAPAGQPNSTALFENTATTGGNISLNLTGPGNTDITFKELASVTDFTGKLSGFKTGDSLNFSFLSGTVTATWNQGAGTLTVAGTGGSAVVSMAGTYTAANFAVAVSASGAKVTYGVKMCIGVNVNMSQYGPNSCTTQLQQMGVTLVRLQFYGPQWYNGKYYNRIVGLLQAGFLGCLIMQDPDVATEVAQIVQLQQDVGPGVGGIWALEGPNEPGNGNNIKPPACALYMEQLYSLVNAVDWNGTFGANKTWMPGYNNGGPPILVASDLGQYQKSNPNNVTYANQGAGDTGPGHFYDFGNTHQDYMQITDVPSVIEPANFARQSAYYTQYPAGPSCPLLITEMSINQLKWGTAVAAQYLHDRLYAAQAAGYKCVFIFTLTDDANPNATPPYDFDLYHNLIQTPIGAVVQAWTAANGNPTTF